MTPDERAFRALAPAQQGSLLDYAEFLVARGLPEAEAVPLVPLDIPRPPRESVVKAIKRLRETYPMIDRNKILHETSALMTQHLVHGKAAADVVDELERLFRRHYEALPRSQ